MFGGLKLKADIKYAQTAGVSSFVVKLKHIMYLKITKTQTYIIKKLQRMHPERKKFNFFQQFLLFYLLLF